MDGRSARLRAASAWALFVVSAVASTASGWWLGRRSGEAPFWPVSGLVAGAMALWWPRRRALVAAGALGSLTGVLLAGGSAGAAVAVAAAVVVGSPLTAWLGRLRIDPTARPETAGRLLTWVAASLAGAVAGSTVTVAGLMPAGAATVADWPGWFVGQFAGSVIVAPGLWAGARWLATRSWQHRAEVTRLLLALGTTLGATAAAVAMWALAGRPEGLLAIVTALGWVAVTSGHRVTVLVSGLSAASALLAVTLGPGRIPTAPAMAVALVAVVVHLGAAALAVEASGRWHARALLAGVIDVAVEAVLIVDGGGRIVGANPAAHAMFGSTDLDGRSLARLLPGFSAEPGAAPAGVIGRRADGSEFFAEATAGRIGIPGRPLRAVVCRDVSSTRETQEALDRAAEIIEATPDFVAWTDPEGTLLSVNSGGRRMVGLEPGEGVLDVPWESIAPARGVEVLRRIAFPEAAARGSWSGDAAFLRGDGTEVPVSLTVIAHRGDDGMVRFLSMIARDVSERYELDAIKDQFVSNVTHELRSPLTGIIGYLALLLEGAYGELDGEVVDALRDIDDSAHRQLDLINDLLAMWRSERTAAAADRGIVAMGELARSVVRSLEPVAARKGVEMTLIEGGGTVVASARDIERAVLNLASNAVKFTSAGGRVTVTVEQVGDRVRVSVADTGIGIPASEQEAVFERFFRASSAEKAGIPGTGLGLPIVRQIARAHGGDVRLESVLGHGTFVLMDLPAAPAAAGDEQADDLPLSA
jgi:PAS domain S-box-containing protein